MRHSLVLPDDLSRKLRQAALDQSVALNRHVSMTDIIVRALNRELGRPMALAEHDQPPDEVIPT